MEEIWGQSATRKQSEGPVSNWAQKVRAEVQKAIIGQRDVIDSLLIALLSDGHVLLEGMPGLAKTLLVNSLAKAVGVNFERIQFTPDLLPSDVVGTMVFQPTEGNFKVHLGPVFANIVLADEINRAPAKVQSALLEAMQEKQVTIGGETHQLPKPFLVMATQNPVEQEGTYPLPEAQADRFLFKIVVDYPTEEEELEMLQRWGQITQTPAVAAVSNGAEIMDLRKHVDAIHVAPEIERYVLALVRETRNTTNSQDGRRPLLAFGASPRATLALFQAGKAMAAMRGQNYVGPEIIQRVFYNVLRHRVGLTYEAEAEDLTPEHILSEILSKTAVPRALEQGIVHSK
ncbi:MAG: MoxR family ATPase [Verrucomicrobiota bacterium]